MATTQLRESAKIYAFPSRRPVAGSADTLKRQVEAHQLIQAAEFGSGWYHDAAMQAERETKQ